MIHLFINSLIIRELSFHVYDFFGLSDHSLIMMSEKKSKEKKRKRKEKQVGLINFL